MDLDALRGVRMGFNFDGMADNVVIGALGADRWEVEIIGRAAHAGSAPERGVSATMILAEAFVSVRADGWFGNIERWVQRYQQHRASQRRRRPSRG